MSSGPEHAARAARELLDDGADARMDGHEALVLVLGGVARAAVADMEHAELPAIQKHVGPLQLLEFSHPHPRVRQNGEGRIGHALDGAEELLDLSGGGLDPES